MKMGRKIFLSNLLIILIAVGIGVFFVWRLTELRNYISLTIPEISKIEEKINTDLIIFLISGFLGVLITVFASLVANRLILKSVLELKKTVEEVINGKKTGIGYFEPKDEVGELAVSFDNLINKLNNPQKNIEKKVNEQIKDIEKKNKKLDDQKKAIMNVLSDVEEEKKKVEQMNLDLEKFKLAAENTGEQIVITDKEGIVLFLNKATEKITGYPIEKAIGKKAGVLWKSPMPKEFYEKMWDTIKNKKKTFKGELQNRRKNGEIYIANLSISPVLDKNGEVIYFVGLERDVTKEREVDRAKTEFVSLASHQLRAPLVAINWYVEMLQSGDAGKLNKEQEKFLGEVYRGSKRMVKLVDDLLNVSRLEAGRLKVEPKKTDLEKLIESVIKELIPYASDHKCVVAFKKPKIKPKKMGLDQALLRQVIHNFIINAIRYSKEKGGKVEVALTKKKNEYVISVSDSGIGVPNEAKSHIFEKFYRADNAKVKETEGSGLGLYLAKMIMDASGGKIWFESPTGYCKNKSGKKEECGSTFYASIPVFGMKAREGEKGLAMSKK